jgi:hypothetical protein
MIPKSKVMGWSNLSMLACTVDTIDCSWHSSLRFINSSANRINAGDWAQVAILGAHRAGGQR